MSDIDENGWTEEEIRADHASIRQHVNETETQGSGREPGPLLAEEDRRLPANDSMRPTTAAEWRERAELAAATLVAREARLAEVEAERDTLAMLAADAVRERDNLAAENARLRQERDAAKAKGARVALRLRDAMRVVEAAEVMLAEDHATAGCVGGSACQLKSNVAAAVDAYRAGQKAPSGRLSAPQSDEQGSVVGSDVRDGSEAHRPAEGGIIPPGSWIIGPIKRGPQPERHVEILLDNSGGKSAPADPPGLDAAIEAAEATISWTHFMDGCDVESLVRAAAPALDAGALREAADGVGLIAAERQRQIDDEGWTSSHDSGHDNEQLAKAAACYAWPYPEVGARPDYPPRLWPWANNYWKPSPDDRMRELVKAGALIAAEIDRLLRERADRIGGAT